MRDDRPRSTRELSDSRIFRRSLDSKIGFRSGCRTARNEIPISHKFVGTPSHRSQPRIANWKSLLYGYRGVSELQCLKPYATSSDGPFLLGKVYRTDPAHPHIAFMSPQKTWWLERLGRGSSSSSDSVSLNPTMGAKSWAHSVSVRASSYEAHLGQALNQPHESWGGGLLVVKRVQGQPASGIRQGI